MSVLYTPPYTPLLYSKTGVYRGKHYFLIFALKHKLWVLVRTVPIIHVLKFKKVKNSAENCYFYCREILQYIAWACLRNGFVDSVGGVLIKSVPSH